MRDRVLAFAKAFMASKPTVAVDGEYYDVPGTTVYTTARLKLPENGRIEVNQIEPGAPADFEWQYEITIKDKLSGEFIHLLLRREGDMVETYGKTVTPVDDERAEEILSLLETLSV